MPDGPTPTLDAAQSDKLRRQLDAWRRQLVALDRRQRQLYFKHTRTASLELAEPGPPDLAILLAARPTRLYTLVPEPDAAAARYGRRVEGGIRVADKRPGELENSLRRLDVVSRQLYADRGLWTLYAGLLMLQWVDPDDHATVLSPIVLMPVELSRPARDQPYLVHRNDEDPVLNPTLRLRMGELGIDLPELDADDPDLPGLRDRIAAAVSARPGWLVLERAVLTTFSFQKEAMYRDLTDNADTILANPHVQLLALGPDAPASADLAFDPPDPQTLDERYPAEELASILDADSSQRACIVSARDGRSFVMDGPPGTGKSQTIANIIVELMAAGKTVLFVSEKAAALDVVRDRLSQAQLGSFLFELHSHAATRKNVVDDLHTTLQQQVLTKALFTDTDRRLLVAMREQLSGHAAAMNQVREPLGRSVFGVIGELGELPRVAGSQPPSDFWAALDDETLRRIADHADRLSRNWRPALEGEDFLWRDLADTEHTEYRTQQLITVVTDAAGSADGAVLIGSAVDDDTGLAQPMSLSAMQRRVRLLQLAERRPQVLDDWLFVPDLAGLSELVLARKSLAGQLIAARGALAATVGSGSADLDDAAAEVVAGLRGLTWAPADDAPSSAVDDLLAFLAAAPARLDEIGDDTAQLGRLLGLPDRGLSLGRARAYTELALLAETPAKPQPGWLNPALQAAVGESVAVLGPSVDLVRRHDRAMREVFTGSALQLDLVALNTRFRESHRGWRRFSAQARADRRTLQGVAVRGKVDRRLIDRLPDAIAWQAAAGDLDVKERQFAAPLGRTYQRLDTDFTRIATALETARRAVGLAGAAVDPTVLGRQLADGGTPDPGLTLIARRLADRVATWIRDTAGHLDRPAIRQIEHLSLADTARWCATRSAELGEPLAAVRRVAEVSGRVITVGQATAALAAARRRTQCEQAIEDSRAEDQRILGPAYAGADTDWATLDAALEWAHQVRDVAGGPLSPATAERLSSLTLDSGLLGNAIDDWRQARGAVLAAFTEERARTLSIDLDVDLRQSAQALREMADTARRDVGEWCAFAQERAALADLELGEAVKAVAAARLPADQVEPAIAAAALRAWLDTTVERDERLRRYQAAERDALVAQYRELDRRIVDQANTLVAARCGQRRPKSLTGRPAQVITREANKKTRHKPIRQLLDEVGSLVTELKPCFMMSPLTVSMFLSPEMRFDAVIFDEASQVVPADAVNCIYRGGQLIVAGDQKQLPPTDFFARAEDADADDTGDDTALDTFQSVLDLCKAAGGLGSLPLTWHYRSRHEDLITYSNYRFYDGSLRTFPGASFDSGDLGVEHVLVDGRYRRSGARDNPIEARKVAELVAHHVHTRPGLSLGVVTFSTAQEDAVRAAIESSGLPEVVDLLEERDRLGGFFVKSLENVQGDERDVIIFSVGYGPDEHGKFTMNFGPLNREGGWRRLNVAITRARHRVEIVSSFKPGQITGVTSAGPLHLRGYLDFAQRGPAALADDARPSQGAAESVFEEQVAAVIRSWGYLVHTQVGAAGYRIDLAVLHPDRPGEYLLGVECDGAAYHSARTARDRDRLREQVLVGLGWRIHRIWGISWWRDRSSQESRLRAAIETAIEAAIESTVEPAIDSAAGPAIDTAGGGRPGRAGRPDAPSRAEIVFDDLDPRAVPGWAVPYRIGADPSAERPADPRSPEARPALRRFFEAALRVEAPVHETVLLSRFRDGWGIGRLGSQIRSNAEYVLSRVRVDGLDVHRDQAGFYRIDGRELAAARIPTSPEATRNVLSIPPEELDLAVVGTVRDAIVIEEEQLAVAVARLFGWLRSGPDIQNAITAAVSRMVQQGRIHRNVRRELRISG